MERKSVARFHLVFLIFFSTIFIVLGQEKVEIENSVDADEVPLSALKWVTETYPDSEVKWFYEETSGEKSYEAKLEWDDRDHSIEFDTTGALEDVEIKIEWEELPELTRTTLSNGLHKEDENYKIRKIQEQLTGKLSHIIQYIQGDVGAEVILRYEIEYYNTTNDKFNLWEGLFSSEGKLLSKRKVRMITTDNLDF